MWFGEFNLIPACILINGSILPDIRVPSGRRGYFDRHDQRLLDPLE